MCGIFEERLMKHIMMALWVLGGVCLSACSHTFEGIGKDLQEIGKSIEDTGKKN